jgi:hypothetical protein
MGTPTDWWADHRQRPARRVVRSGESCCAFPFETIATQNRTTLSWPERHGGGLATLRTSGRGFDLGFAFRECARKPVDAPGLATLAAFGLVPELFLVEELLIPDGEYEVSATVNTLQYLVLKFH